MNFILFFTDIIRIKEAQLECILESVQHSSAMKSGSARQGPQLGHFFCEANNFFNFFSLKHRRSRILVSHTLDSGFDSQFLFERASKADVLSLSVLSELVCLFFSCQLTAAEKNCWQPCILLFSLEKTHWWNFSWSFGEPLLWGFVGRNGTLITDKLLCSPCYLFVAVSKFLIKKLSVQSS